MTLTPQEQVPNIETGLQNPQSPFLSRAIGQVTERFKTAAAIVGLGTLVATTSPVAAQDTEATRLAQTSISPTTTDTPQTALFTQDTIEFYTGEQLTHLELETRFTDAIDTLSRGGDTPIVEGGVTIAEALVYIETDENIGLAMGYFSRKMPVDEAILQVYMDLRFKQLGEIDNPQLQSRYLEKLHAEAIYLGKQEYVLNAVALHPRYNTGRLAKKSYEEKILNAGESYDFFIKNFFEGTPTNKESYEDLVMYNPLLAQYLINQGDDFGTKVQGHLQGIIELIQDKEELSQAQEELSQAQEELSQAKEELTQAQEELRASFQRLAETMISRGMGS